MSTLYINDVSYLSMSQEDLQRWLPQKVVLDLLEDIDDYFLEREGYAGTQTQEQVVSKRVELRDRAKIVTMETVIFLKELLAATDKIATGYVKKGSRLPAPWPRVSIALERLMTIV
jgi:hypothetical protein